jgi:hypothetical protein
LQALAVVLAQFLDAAGNVVNQIAVPGQRDRGIIALL